MTERFPDDLLLGEARERVRADAAVGLECPCCGQHAKEYRRPITAVAARAVIALWRVHARAFGHLPTVTRSHLADVADQGGYRNLGVHWGLIEDERAIRGDAGRVGFWRVTPLGVAWIHGRTTIPRYARLYAGNLRGLDGPQITFSDALGARFRVEDLLGPLPAASAGPSTLFELAAIHRQAA